MEIYVDDSKLTLHGLQQHYVKLAENEKNRKLNELLDALEFNQVVCFVKSVQRAIQLNKLLQETRASPDRLAPVSFTSTASYSIFIRRREATPGEAAVTSS